MDAEEILRVVLIGPESTGKTRLAGALAQRYGVPWSPEYARTYAEERVDPLGFPDVDPLGRGQKASEDATVAHAQRLGVPLVLLDTDLVSTMVYSRHYYGDCPGWIEEQVEERRGDLYLLHHVDVDWVADGHQRVEPERRHELFESFRATLLSLGVPFSDITGSWEERERRANDAVDRLLSRLDD